MFSSQPRVGISKELAQITRRNNGFFKHASGIKFSLTTFGTNSLILGVE